MKWLIGALIYHAFVQCIDRNGTDLRLLSKTRTSYLQQFQGYSGVIILHLQIPDLTPFVALQIEGEESRHSLFACSSRKALVYMKHKSIPVINGDDSKMPDKYKNISGPPVYQIDVMTDKSKYFLNITSPVPGYYYIGTFLPYTNPKDEPIKPPGLQPKCYARLDVTLYAEKPLDALEVVEGVQITFRASQQTTSGSFHHFRTPEIVTHVILIVEDTRIVSPITLNIGNKIPGDDNNATKTVVLGPNDKRINIPIITPSNDYFVQFLTDDTLSNLTYKLKFFRDVADDNGTLYYPTESITRVAPYKKYDLVRDSSTDSFSYSFELREQYETTLPVALNLTSDKFVALEFKLYEHTDIGGALLFTIALKPRFDDKKKRIPEPSGYKIVACVRPGVMEFPDLESSCHYEREVSVAPILLNGTIQNSSVLIPYPTAGTWYATLRLFCQDDCVPCDCSDHCQKEYTGCVAQCQVDCVEDSDCALCPVDCKAAVIQKAGCGKCDCDGNCLKTSVSCRSNVLFDISSSPCANNCGVNGRCVFMVSDGVAYAACVCTNKYRGWDCTEASDATPLYLVLLELLLLVLSNLMFLPAVYFAYRRKCYVEAVTYLSICFFSTFYHACDAGENIYSYCIARLSALQFADFYCALLAVWVTLIAIADLPCYWPGVCQIAGAVILAFITTINKTAVWAFLVPSIAGVCLIGVSWFLKWRKVRQMFLNRRYLYVFMPVGALVVAVGLIIFTLLQTNSNYKYLHSMWHMIMATGVILLLPTPDTFQPTHAMC